VIAYFFYNCQRNGIAVILPLLSREPYSLAEASAILSLGAVSLLKGISAKVTALIDKAAPKNG